MVKSATHMSAVPEWPSKLEVVEERHSHLSKREQMQPLLKVSWFRNFFLMPSLSSKKRTKTSQQVVKSIFFLFVFGRKVSLKKLFWICLTFMIVLNATHNLIDSTWLKKQQFSCQGVQNVSPLSFSNYSSGAHTAAGLLRWVNQLSLVADFGGPQ